MCVCVWCVCRRFHKTGVSDTWYSILFRGNNNKLVRCETKHNGELVLGQDGNAIRVDFPLGVTVRQVG